MTTVPLSAALIGVPDDAPMSTPLWIRVPPEIGWVRGPNPLVAGPFTGQMNREFLDGGAGPAADGVGVGLPRVTLAAGPEGEGDGAGFPRLTLAAICAWIWACTALYSASNSAFRERIPSMSCCSCAPAAVACSRSASAAARSCVTRSRSSAATRSAACAFDSSCSRSRLALSTWSLRLPCLRSSLSNRREFSSRYLLPATSSWAPAPVDSNENTLAPPFPEPLYSVTVDS